MEAAVGIDMIIIDASDIDMKYLYNYCGIMIQIYGILILF